MQHGGCGAWHALCHGPVYAWHDGSCERAVCVKCGHVGREEVRGRKKWDVEPQSPRVHARVRVAPAMRARVWTVETSEKEPQTLSFPFPRNVPNGSARNGVPERSERWGVKPH